MTVTTSIKTLAFASLLALAPAQMMAAQKGGTFTTGDKTFLLNGKPFVVKAAELHYPRIPRAYWEHRIKMCKALGMNTVCLYVFWNIHEQEEGKFDFTGNNDVAAFCRLARRTACMSSFARVHTFVQNGKWVVCLGGSSRRRISVCVSRILTSCSE